VCVSVINHKGKTAIINHSQLSTANEIRLYIDPLFLLSLSFSPVGAAVGQFYHSNSFFSL